MLQPLWLVVVLCGQHTGVEQHQDDDEPEHGLGLDSTPTVATRLSVPSETTIINYSDTDAIITFISDILNYLSICFLVLCHQVSSASASAAPPTPTPSRLSLLPPFFSSLTAFIFAKISQD